MRAFHKVASFWVLGLGLGLAWGQKAASSPGSGIPLRIEVVNTSSEAQQIAERLKKGEDFVVTLLDFRDGNCESGPRRSFVGHRRREIYAQRIGNWRGGISFVPLTETQRLGPGSAADLRVSKADLCQCGEAHGGSAFAIE